MLSDLQTLVSANRISCKPLSVTEADKPPCHNHRLYDPAKHCPDLVLTAVKWQSAGM